MSSDLALPEGITFKPGDGYAALRALADGMKAAADVVLEQAVKPTAEATGTNSFSTPFGKVYSSTTPAKVEILPSADLMEWVAENLPVRDAQPEDGGPSIIPEHEEDQFDERQVQQALGAYVALVHGGGAVVGGNDQKAVLTILRAAFRPRLVSEKLAPWVIPYLTERAKIESEKVTVPCGECKPSPPYEHEQACMRFGDEPQTETRWTVLDSVTGEEWPWARVVPEKVIWNAKIGPEHKAAAANAILDALPDVVGLVGVKAVEK